MYAPAMRVQRNELFSPTSPRSLDPAPFHFHPSDEDLSPGTPAWRGNEPKAAAPPQVAEGGGPTAGV